MAGIEAALALRDLGGDALAISLLTPEPEFVYRPMTVREPFAFQLANHYPVADIATDLGIDLIQDRLDALDGDRRTVHTEAGKQLPYDALLLALGARIEPRFKHAITIDDRQLDEQLHGLIQDIEAGYLSSIAFISPTPMPWPLPLYELALMTKRRAYDMNIELEVTIITPEDGPLAVFGAEASQGVAALLEQTGIRVLSSEYAEVPERGRVELHPGGGVFEADRIVALPQLVGPAAPGVPKDSPNGFIPVDERCRVRGLDRVWAAGDGTDFPVKMGGVAAEQADTAAADIVALAGVGAEPPPLAPEIHAILIGGPKPLYLSAYLTGGHGSTSRISETPSWSPKAKIAAKYLAPYLEERDSLAERAR